MPLPMVHLGVAKHMIDKGFGISNASQFYLGVISPDAIHMRQDTERVDKNKTHLIPKDKTWFEVDCDEYYSFLTDYIMSNKDCDRDFLWGYGIHILTDMHWVKHIYYDFNMKYENDKSPIQDKSWAYYNDTDRLDQVLYNESSWRDEVWQELQASKGIGCLGLLSAGEIDLWKERTLHWYDSGESRHKNPIKYIMLDDVKGFILSCTDQIIQGINNQINHEKGCYNIDD